MHTKEQTYYKTNILKDKRTREKRTANERIKGIKVKRTRILKNFQFKKKIKIERKFFKVFFYLCLYLSSV